MEQPLTTACRSQSSAIERQTLQCVEFFFWERETKEGADFSLQRVMIRCSERGWTCIYRKRKRGFAQSLVREREGGKNSKSCFFFDGERECVWLAFWHLYAYLLTLFCLILFWFIFFLFVPLGIGRQCLVIWGLTFENVKGDDNRLWIFWPW